MEQPSASTTKTFEQAVTRLEEISTALDRNDIPLAEALQLCAEAAELTRLCRTQLTEAEGKLEQLIEAANGDIRLVSLDNDLETFLKWIVAVSRRIFRVWQVGIPRVYKDIPTIPPK